MSGFRESKQLQKTAQGVNHLTGTKRELEKLTQKRVKELLDYDPETGLLTWKVDRGRQDAGSIAGCSYNAYKVVGIDGKVYKQHRIIWLLIYGYFPEHDIDHISKDKHDNRLCNLREATRSCNLRNATLARNSSTGVKGVCNLSKSGRYKAQIVSAMQKNCTLYTGSDLVEAVAHRLAAEQCLGYSSCDNQSSAFIYMQNYIKEKRPSKSASEDLEI